MMGLPHFLRTRSDAVLLAAVAAVLGLTPIWAGAAETPTGALGMLTGAPMQRSLPLIPGAVEPGVRSLGLGSAAGRGPDGVGTGACPLGTNMAGSAAMAPLIPNLNISTSGAGAEQNFGAGPDLAVGPVSGATYGEHLGGGPGSV